MENKKSYKFKKISKHFYNEYPPIMKEFTSISGTIYDPKMEDSFIISFFIAYFQLLTRTKQGVKQLRSFNSIYESCYMKFFDNNSPEKLKNSLTTLLKIETIISNPKKSQEEDVIKKLDKVIEKRKDLKLIANVSLFYLLSKLRSQESDKTIRKNLLKKIKEIKDNEELEFSKDLCFFLSSLFKINFTIYFEEKLDEKPEVIFHSKKSLNLAMLRDKNKGWHVLIKENVEEIGKIHELNEEILLSKQDFELTKSKLCQEQLKANSLVKALQISQEINQILLENLDNWMNILESLPRSEKQNKKLSDMKVVKGKLKSIKIYEKKLNLLNHRKNVEDVSSKTLLDSVNGLIKKHKKLTEQDNDDDDKLTVATNEFNNVNDDFDESYVIEKKKNDARVKELAMSINNLRKKKERDDLKAKNDFKTTIDSEEEKENFDDLVKDEEINKFECPICFERCPEKEVFSFGCDHNCCKECLKNYITNRIDNGQLDLMIQCMSGDCSMRYDFSRDTKLLMELIGKEKFNVLNERLANNFITNYCAGCKMGFELDKDNEATTFMCDCGVHTCLNCGEIQHKGKFCEKKLTEIQLALNDNRMRCCPVCQEIYLKDDHCEHVKCFKCKTDFCYNCSAVRKPILGHGGHYHRRGCRYFFKKRDPKTKVEILTDEMEAKCLECQKNKEVCKRPELDLKSFYEPLGLNIENEENPYDNE